MVRVSESPTATSVIGGSRWQGHYALEPYCASSMQVSAIRHSRTDLMSW